MIHLQYNTPGWNEALSRLPDGALIKLVDMVQTAAEVKAANPKLKVLLRHVNNEGYVWSLDWEANVHKARAEYQTYIDGTFAHYAHLVDYVEEPRNEYVDDNMAAEEVAKRVMWARACAFVWQAEFRPHYPHIRVLIGNTPVGNHIPLGFAQAAKAFGAGLAVHAYIHFGQPGVRDPLDFQYHSGRWNGDDALFRANGIRVPMAITETGPYGSTWDGWRSPAVLGGSVEGYLTAVRDWIRDVRGTVAYQEGRLIGFNLFTTIGGDDWEYYQTNQPELNRLADMVRQEWTTVTPPPIDPPPPDPAPLPADVVAQLWQLSDAWPHKVNFAPQLGLWKAILEDGRAPVHTELSTVIDGKQYAFQQAFEPGMENELHVWTPGLPLLVLQRPTTPPPPPPVPHVERPQGVDVSRWQGVMNWPKTRQKGGYYAFIKATESVSWVDPLFDENWQEARAAGLLVGAYHFFRPGYDPVQQANHFVNTVKAQPGAAHLPFVLDVEIAPTAGARSLEVEDGYMGQSLVGLSHKGFGRVNMAAAASFAADVQTCLERIGILTGRLPLLYTGIAFWNTYLRAVPTNVCQLWLANWTANADPAMPKDWGEWTFWQFSNNGSGADWGAQSARIDVNKFNGTLAQLYEYAGEW
jgi:lysozyme